MKARVFNRPLAVEGFVSYRCRNAYGCVMIAARTDDEALQEAARSMTNPKRENLEIWNGVMYVPVAP